MPGRPSRAVAPEQLQHASHPPVLRRASCFMREVCWLFMRSSSQFPAAQGPWRGTEPGRGLSRAARKWQRWLADQKFSARSKASLDDHGSWTCQGSGPFWRADAFGVALALGKGGRFFFASCRAWDSSRSTQPNFFSSAKDSRRPNKSTPAPHPKLGRTNGLDGSLNPLVNHP